MRHRLLSLLTKVFFCKLNTRNQWQLDHKLQGLKFVPIDLSKAKIYVFVDSSFFNNRDLTSQISFISMVRNHSILDCGEDDAVIAVRGNLIYWSSFKCKPVTQNALVSKIF